jgi:hypothetical protein
MKICRIPPRYFMNRHLIRNEAEDRLHGIEPGTGQSLDPKIAGKRIDLGRKRQRLPVSHANSDKIRNRAQERKRIVAGEKAVSPWYVPDGNQTGIMRPQIYSIGSHRQQIIDPAGVRLRDYRSSSCRSLVEL